MMTIYIIDYQGGINWDEILIKAGLCMWFQDIPPFLGSLLPPFL